MPKSETAKNYRRMGFKISKLRAFKLKDSDCLVGTREKRSRKISWRQELLLFRTADVERVNMLSAGVRVNHYNRRKTYSKILVIPKRSRKCCGDHISIIISLLDLVNSVAGLKLPRKK